MAAAVTAMTAAEQYVARVGVSHHGFGMEFVHRVRHAFAAAAIWPEMFVFLTAHAVFDVLELCSGPQNVQCHLHYFWC